MSAKPWHGGAFDLPAEPSDGDLRRALQLLVTGGAVGGSPLWLKACTRCLRGLGPDPDGGEEAAPAYMRVSGIVSALQPPPTGVLAKAGRGLARPPEPAQAPRRPSKAEQVRRLLDESGMWSGGCCERGGAGVVCGPGPNPAAKESPPLE